MSRTHWRRMAGRVVSFAVLTLIAYPSARAGQVRVTVGVPTDTFTPYVVNINLGDHVTWVWGTSGHTVTNWTLPADSLAVNFDGTVFDSDAGGGHIGQPSSTRFSWKSDRLGHVPYVCVPHIPSMTARIIVTDPGVSPPIDVADFRITEVQYDAASGQDRIEITNYGLALGNLGRFRIASAGASAELVGPAGASISIMVPSGDRVVIHLNAAGVNTNTDIFMSFAPGIGLPDAAGSLALYVPHSISPGNALSNAAMIIDFVQWGAGAQSNEATAVNAGFWGSGTFIPPVAATHSIEYCPDGAIGHGVNRWAEVATPNFGLDGQCATPVRNESWGRMKTLYRP